MKTPAEGASEKDMEEHSTELRQDDADAGFSPSIDICQQLLHRYVKSSSPQHRHLCAIAAATRSILNSDSLPLSPISYFAASISTLSSSEALDSDAITALTSFLAIVLPLVPTGSSSISPEKAISAIDVLVELVERQGDVISTASARAVVKSLGLLLEFCDLEDLVPVKRGFRILLRFSLDKKPKVRKYAQDSFVKAFNSFESPIVKKEASKIVLNVLKRYMPLAVKLSAQRVSNGVTKEVSSKPEHLEVVHMLNIVKHVLPHLTVKSCQKLLPGLISLMTSHYSLLTRHIFSLIGAVFETWKSESIIPETESIIKAMTSYISLGRKNPVDTIVSAANLLKNAHRKLKFDEAMDKLPLVFSSIAGLLTSEATASQASSILREIIVCELDGRDLFTLDNSSSDDLLDQGNETTVVKSTCVLLENLLDRGILSEHVLTVISALFTKLGASSYLYLRDIILKLAAATLTLQDKSKLKHLHECIGSAVIAMGPEKMLTLLPISYNLEDHSYSNVWMISILKNYVVGSSLGFFMEHIMPIAKSFQQASSKVKESAVREDLQAYAHSCWALLPSFCRYPTDICQNFECLTKILKSILAKDSMMVENIALALKELVYSNVNVLRSSAKHNEFAMLPEVSNNDYISIATINRRPPYTKKTATRNIKTLELYSKELLEILTNVFLDSYSEKRPYLKDAIRCLATISDTSVREMILKSSLDKCQIISTSDVNGESEKQMDVPSTNEDKSLSLKEKGLKRCLILELAYLLVDGASEEMVPLFLRIVKNALEGSDGFAESEAYLTLSCILEEHSSAISSHDVELLDLVLKMKPPTNITSRKRRFSCLKIFFVHEIKKTLDEENTKAFLILNEIISAIKDSTEEAREAAYSILLEIDASLRDSSSAISDGHHEKFVNMIMGYLSGSSPHIRSGVVSALSILVYNNAAITHSIEDLVPSVLALLENKAIEVVKAVLGFVKVVVSCHEVKDIQKFLPEILKGVLPWSSVSKHHFKSKVALILEILIRKCGIPMVQSLTPEKFRNFIKTVSENRRRKEGTKETGSFNLPQPSVPESSFRQRKRKQVDSGNQGDNNQMESRKKKWGSEKPKGPIKRNNHVNGNNNSNRGKQPGASQARDSKRKMVDRKNGDFGRQTKRKTSSGRD
ncbi:RRP12-like protein [Impatiens glandulifera]|uniref:RRP12-like protein n=1 Tax=Impatiens glandulifera TaxID=253017 RepID=UPI001FB08B9A|nr:RRP12-like protein [Impatiens glandulifera]